ncbi:MAG: HEAT repeat domain-containing protein [Candidatus Heimdallarchaeota archaeon]|nr:HEAT repeat domain-containing protein [Candidatus Heimdallarchaeota archaeon]MDH5646923.1 HEAT repeat domain-containing protein [Candidatus Heimdallarchaeota archaeon]
MTSKTEIKDILDDLKYGHPETRKGAALKLGRIRDITVIPHLVKCLKEDTYPWTRVSAIQSLTWIAHESIIEPLIDVAKHDKDLMVRRTAIESLGNMRNRSALQILNDIVNNESEDNEIKKAASIAILVIEGLTPSYAQDSKQSY